MSQIALHPLFTGVSSRGKTDVTISGTVYSPDWVCSDLEVALACTASRSVGPAKIDGRTGSWSVKLTTECGCGTDLVTVVASSAALGISSTSTGPIVCYVDWHNRSLIDRVLAHRWMISPRQLLAPANLGACYKCITISAALLVLSLLVLGIGVIANLPLVTITGLLAAAIFGLLVGLHAVFFLLKRGKSVVYEPQRRSCCGG